MTTALTRDARVRRGGRGRGWALLTTLLVLALGASSALVFTDRVELLKLAVILSLWAAVVAAFVSVIYRRQSDVAQARARDMKLVYDLQLDREIAARREYELTVESHLRRELVAELRAEAADEIAALRSELIALRTNLEILFDTDLEHRPALETDRHAVHAFSDRAAADTETTGWVTGGPMPTVFAADPAGRTVENPILDVPEVAVPPTGGMPFGRPADEPAPAAPEAGGHHRRTAGAEPQPGYRPEPAAPPQPEPVEQPAARQRGAAQPAATGWQPPPADAGWQPTGRPPGGPWAPAGEPAPEPRPGRHSGPGEPAPAAQPGWPQQPEPAEYRPRHAPGAGYTPPMPTRPEPRARHRSLAETPEPPEAPAPPAPPEPAAPVEPVEQPGGRSGQSVADLLARLQVNPGSTGRRRRRQE